MKAKIYFRSKNVWNNEQQALQNVLENQPIDRHNLKPKHTHTHFAWQFVAGTLKDTFIVNLKEVQNKSHAIEQAKMYFNTFEGNLKIVNENDTHIVFTKVRQ